MKMLIRDIVAGLFTAYIAFCVVGYPWMWLNLRRRVKRLEQKLM